MPACMREPRDKQSERLLCLRLISHVEALPLDQTHYKQADLELCQPDQTRK